MMQWLKKMRERRKADNRGLTLVELICTVAIFGVVCTAVGSVMVVSARTYGRSNDEINMQQEAQLTANQIADLIIDTTSEVIYEPNPTNAEGGVKVSKGDTEYTVNAIKELRIKNGTMEYVVSYVKIEEVGYLTYTEIHSGESGILAENIDDFNADVSDFSNSGNARVYLAFKDEREREYAAWYTVTARNGGVDGSGPAVLNETAMISTIKKITLEPNEKVDFTSGKINGEELIAPTTVIGSVSNKGLNWSLSGNLDSDTSLSSTGVLEIGANEKSSNIEIMVSTQATESGVALAQEKIEIHIRRVNEISADGWLVSGTDYEKDAVYQVDSTVTDGMNLARIYGVAYDDAVHYKNPYYMNYSYEFFVDGASVGKYENGSMTGTIGSYIEIVGGAPIEDSVKTHLYLRLRQEMPANSKLVVTATAKHPLGANKTGIEYGGVAPDQWILERPESGGPHNPPEGGIRRGTQQYYVGFNEADQKQIYLDTDDQQGDYKNYWRYRMAGEAAWSEWMDFEGGINFNVQPADTVNKYMRPDCDYEIQILTEVERNNKVLWPLLNNVQYEEKIQWWDGQPEKHGDIVKLRIRPGQDALLHPVVDINKVTTPKSEFLSTLKVSRAYMTFTCDELGYSTGVLNAGTYTNPINVTTKTYQWKYDVVVGTDKGYVQSNMNCKLYVYEGGEWKNISNLNKINTFNDYMQWDLNNNLTKGLIYRIELDWKDWKGTECSYGEEAVEGQGGVGVFYFKLN